MKIVRQKKPSWLATRIGSGREFRGVRQILAKHALNTVCQSAACPNRGECFGSGTATFMILGDRCTRGCRFCAVTRDAAPSRVDAEEPRRLAAAAEELGIRYAVVTSVTRDDLPDGGADQFVKTVAALRALPNRPLVELLIPDYSGDALAEVLAAAPDVLAHNIEVTRALSKRLRHPRFDYDRSLCVLGEMKTRANALITKSSIMLGLGESESEVLETMADLRSVNVDILVLGQYLRPTLDNAPVIEYVSPERFERLAELGAEMGFGFVASHPLARTSYRAREAYEQLTAGVNRPN